MLAVGLITRQVIAGGVWTWFPPGNVLKTALPVLWFEPPEETPVNQTPTEMDGSAVPAVELPGVWLGDIGVKSINYLLGNQIPVFGDLGQLYNRKTLPVAVEMEGDDFPEIDILREDPREDILPPAPVSGGDSDGHPVVLVYHTHSAETYAATDKTSRLEGKNGGVFTVGRCFGERLISQHAVQVVQADTIHDFPTYDDAYSRSQKTVQAMLGRYPRVLAVFDLHRDAGPARETVTIRGRKVARILFVVGTNTRASHPNWRLNLQFAETLAAKLEELYPGVCKGVVTKEGRYHQQLHPQALLIEIGNDRNSTTEALGAADLLADAVGEVLKQFQGDNQPNKRL
ncbi:MAG: stage II sporulation protein P [Heliobacteriaceae bacterium]|nr:stage II sporulation protein P [Heliobacteriaceae bacterium]